MKNNYFINGIFIVTFIVFIASCKTEQYSNQDLLETIENYENAWAAGDFITVESHFAKNAKRLHTEPYVWDRKEIKRYFEERAKLEGNGNKNFVKNAWKKDRKYLEIRVEGKIAYDVFTTDRFKALHIWEKQQDGSWKIIYDMGMLNYPCEE